MRRQLLLVLALGMLLLAVVGLGMWVGGQSAPGQVASQPRVGRPALVERDQLAPLFTLKTTTGQVVELEKMAGEVVLVNFWATWCPPCRDEMPVIEAMHQKYRDRGFRVLAVNVQEMEPQVTAFGREMGLSFPLLLDQTAEVARMYRVQNLPRSFFLARDGRVVRIHPGELTQETVERYLQELL